MQIKINKIFDYAAIASGLILFFLAILTFCDVFGRRFLNSPVAGTIEIVEFGIALVAFLAMPRAFFLNAHVSADFIKNISNTKLQTFITIFRFILMLVIMSFVAYGTTKEAFAFLNNNRVTIDLELSFYPFYFASAIAMWTSVLAIVLWFTKAISERDSQ
tara:strand:- start:1081 stop:1560 length:480 start_codon:yes stop_codon:yes gene_type:complete